MLIEILKSKIYKVPITHINMYPIDSIIIDEDYMDEVNLIEGEKVQILNTNNNKRIETYVVKGERGSKIVGVTTYFSHVSTLSGPQITGTNEVSYLQRVNINSNFNINDIIIITSYTKMNYEKAKEFKPLQLIF